MSCSSRKSRRAVEAPKPSPRCGPSRNGTRPTSTVIWPRSRRRMEHVLTAVQLALGKSETPSKTDFVSNSVDAAVKPLIKKHDIILPADCAFSDTQE